MARKNAPTEEELGIAPTTDELSQQAQGADIPSDFYDDDEDAGDDAAPPVAAVAPAEPAAPPAAATEETERQPRMVDYRALQEERRERRLVEERTNQVLERLAALQEERAKPAAPAPEQAPDRATQPMEFMDWQERRIASLEERFNRETSEREQRAQAETEERTAIEVTTRHFNDAVAADPSVKTAYDAVYESFYREATAYGLSGQALQEHLRRTELQHMVYAIRNNIPVGDFVKNLAISRGWNGQAAAPAAPADPAPAPQQPVRNMADVRQRQQRHMSLGDASGSAPPAKIDAKALAKMSRKEFTAFMGRLGNGRAADAEMDALMGGSE